MPYYKDDYLNSLVGKKIRFILGKLIVIDAMLQKELYQGVPTFFICQNQMSGIPCSDKLGYKYSYAIRADALTSISDLELL